MIAVLRKMFVSVALRFHIATHWNSASRVCCVMTECYFMTRTNCIPLLFPQSPTPCRMWWADEACALPYFLMTPQLVPRTMTHTQTPPITRVTRQHALPTSNTHYHNCRPRDARLNAGNLCSILSSFHTAFYEGIQTNQALATAFPVAHRTMLVLPLSTTFSEGSSSYVHSELPGGPVQSSEKTSDTAMAQYDRNRMNSVGKPPSGRGTHGWTVSISGSYDQPI
jgi:hypothetical protein